MPIPAINDPIPNFTLQNQDGTPVSLSDYASTPVVLFFYPRAGCPIHDRFHRHGWECNQPDSPAVVVAFVFFVCHHVGICFSLLSLPLHLGTPRLQPWVS
jgi:AhpC/TSA family